MMVTQVHGCSVGACLPRFESDHTSFSSMLAIEGSLRTSTYGAMGSGRRFGCGPFGCTRLASFDPRRFAAL